MVGGRWSYVIASKLLEEGNKRGGDLTRKVNLRK